MSLYKHDMVIKAAFAWVVRLGC